VRERLKRWSVGRMRVNRERGGGEIRGGEFSGESRTEMEFA
jgi:hypothetical protein